MRAFKGRLLEDNTAYKVGFSFYGRRGTYEVLSITEQQYTNQYNFLNIPIHTGF